MSNVRQKKTDRHHGFDRQDIRIPIIKIKKEPTESEPAANTRPTTAEFADNAMSEILGWYGSIRRQRSPTIPTSPSGSHKSYSAESEDDSGSTRTTKLPGAKLDACGWCSNPLPSDSMFAMDEKAFCSEVCFTQCRRARFKKSKTCDWCRHIRHTVNYVDFQQLQFCSNKCLNQYKMNIFCKETQEHLDLHPHPIESEPKMPSFSNVEDSALITPELWMNNHEDSPPPADVDNVSSSDTPSPPLLPHYPPKPSILNGSLSESSKMKTIRTKKKSKLLEKQNFQMKFKKMPHYSRPHPSLPFYRSPFPTPSMMFDLPAFRNPPPLLRILRPTLPPQPSPVSHPPPPVPNPITQALPPPTTLVPYPVIIPLPIPVPIVIPLPINPEEFYRILNGKKEAKDVEQNEREIDTNDCQTNKPMKKRKKITSLMYGASSISEKPKDTIVIHTDEKDDMSSNKVSLGNQTNNKKPCKDDPNAVGTG